MKKMLLGLVAFFSAIVIIYFLGPRPESIKLVPLLPSVPTDLVVLEKQIKELEDATANIKPDNQARIVWADSANQKTSVSIVYIHGFGASWAEADPVIMNLAKRYKANLYLARLHDAGIDDPNAFDDLTPKIFVEGAKRALAIGQQIGDSVIVVGTSAGGLLSTYLAATNPSIKALVLYSPCFATYKNMLAISTGPWGETLLKWILGERAVLKDDNPQRQAYWLTSQNTNGHLALQQTIEAIVNYDTFKRIKMPVFLGYYYKNKQEQDKTVSVDAMLDMFTYLGTPNELKVIQAFPNAGHHVIASQITSQDWQSVQTETEKFLESVVGLTPLTSLD